MFSRQNESEAGEKRSGLGESGFKVGSGQGRDRPFQGVGGEKSTWGDGRREIEIK
ncbi:hypothetical protein [Phormidium sp. CCY1219]|uniref:hypothetical protein n=1 Tax=Phormidium sp. CCY1219 TaxID=2886104 RepID=UPI002D78B134|nr:hypothetical protein [Phormidium sp. CCY1219]